MRGRAGALIGHGINLIAFLFALLGYVGVLGGNGWAVALAQASWCLFAGALLYLLKGVSHE